VTDHSFSQWRGSSATITGAWADTDAQTQQDVATLKDFTSWAGDIDLAVGGTALNTDESFAQAAAGAYRARWTTMAQNIQRYRSNSPGVTYIRPWHEFNGNWYKNWFVTPENVEDYKKSFRLMAQTIRENCPRCMVVWSPNNGSSDGAAPLESAYPGDDVVDVISIDSYNANGNVVVTDQQKWAEYATASKNGEPVGVEAWRQFAERHGKPLALSEWGLNPAGGGGDNPEYIRRMHDWMAQHAVQPGDSNTSGKILYDVYFNVAHQGNTGFLIKDGPNPTAGRTYQSLRWGNQNDPTALPVEQTPPQLSELLLIPQPSTTETSSPPAVGSTPTTAPPLPATAPTPAIVPVPATVPATVPVPTITPATRSAGS
jgi:beta-mannanase